MLVIGGHRQVPLLMVSAPLTGTTKGGVIVDTAKGCQAVMVAVPTPVVVVAVLL